MQKGRAKLLRQTIADADGDAAVLVRAVRGYAEVSREWSDEVRGRCDNPEFILRPAKLDLHLDAYAQIAQRYEALDPPGRECTAGAPPAEPDADSDLFGGMEGERHG